MSPLLSWPHPTALWIWSDEWLPGETNARFRFEREFSKPAGECDSLILDITADSRYRLWVNGTWINDGPARSYADAPFFDSHPIGHLLTEGTNRLQVEVTSFGVDTFQSIRSQPGLLVGLRRDDRKSLLISDETWLASRVASHSTNTPRICCQLGFVEQVDLTIAPFTPRRATLAAKNNTDLSLQARDTKLLGATKRPFPTLLRRSSIQSVPPSWTFHIREHLSPFPRSINVHGFAGVLGTCLTVPHAMTITFLALGPVYSLSLNGRPVSHTVQQDLKRYTTTLEAGEHWLSLAICDRYDHITELTLGCVENQELTWSSPLDDGLSPWISTGPMWRADRDTNCRITRDGKIDESVDAFDQTRSCVAAGVESLASQTCAADFLRFCGHEAHPIPATHFAPEDVYFCVRTDEEIASSETNPSSLANSLTLQPGERVLLDLEDMTNGFFQTEIEAKSDFILDGYFFEHCHLTPTGCTIQYLHNEAKSYRNALRLKGTKGRSHFLSAQRRGFRYGLLTLRPGGDPITLHRPGVVESIYTPTRRATFQSSDENLNRIFRMSQRTLQLCMEDTFTDCPSYEQVFWVGDARIEGPCASLTFGAYDLTEHCLRLAAGSLRTLPLVAGQCPSGWDVLLPGYSSLWIMSVWEAYWQTGKTDLLHELWPAVESTLDTALKICTQQGLFSAPTWNFFDWAGLDQDQPTVLHISMLLAGSLEATRSFPDAIAPNGSPRSIRSQHTSFLALLFNLLPDADRKRAALHNCLHPPANTVTVGSPFAMHFLLEALLQEGQPEPVLKKIRDFWSPMVNANSPTCWEMLFTNGEPFPTRSHCHGWSASPVHLLPSIFFGLEILEPGWKKIRIIPRLLDLEYVDASVCTPWGLLTMHQKLNPDGSVHFDYKAPSEIQVIVAPSPITKTSDMPIEIA
ncbi:MAG: hypothetical protein B9S32_00780 [Verrucomicrobia bacterium Tous-C9LFEB]|nr:MAG: hypothetical protein B9S32_00780 [Verrucomicrobia bacterium Tous-C9LFEB]